MTDLSTSTVVQLQYCPVCRHLIRPSLLTTPEAVLKDGAYFHAACLGKAERPITRSQAPGMDFDNEDGAPTDFQNYDKVVVESITAIRNRRPGGTGGTGGTGQHSAVRRKTTTSAASSGVPSGRNEEVPLARRSGPALRSYSEPRRQSPAVLVGGIVGALVLIAVGAFFLMNIGGSNSTPTVIASDPPLKPPHTASPPLSPPGPLTNPNVAPPLVAPPPGPDLAAPLPHLPPTSVAPQPTPYEVAHRGQPPELTFEAAGPAVLWFDGTTLGDWKVTKVTAPGSVSCKDGAIEVDPGPSPVVMEHPLSASDYDLDFEFRVGLADMGAYAECWLPQGVVKMTGVDFQSTAWTPVHISVHGGKVTATNGTKGPTDVHPAAVDSGAPGGDAAAFLNGRQMVIFHFSSNDTKSVRNIQFTPMRLAATAALPPPPLLPPPPQETPPPPTPPVVVAAGGTPLALPLVMQCSGQEQAEGRWQRMRAATENDRTFMTWEYSVSKAGTADFLLNSETSQAPARLHLKMEYRIRNAKSTRLLVRLWYIGNHEAELVTNAPELESWQTLDADIDDCAGFLHQIEVRLTDNPGDTACLDIASATLSLANGAAPVVATPPALPVPAPAPAAAVVLTVPAKALDEAGGHWNRVSLKTEAGLSFLAWTSTSLTQAYPFFEIRGKQPELPQTVKVRLSYRVTNCTEPHILVRIFSAGGFHQGALPAAAVGEWHDGECTITGIPAPVGQIEVRFQDLPPVGSTLSVSSLTIVNPNSTASGVNEGNAAAPKALLRLEATAEGELGGRWNRTVSHLENGVTFMHWDSAPTFAYYTLAADLPVPAVFHVKTRIRVKNYTQKFILIRPYGPGVSSSDQGLTMGPADADGWAIAEGDVRNAAAKLHEFELKPSGERDPQLAMDFDWLEIAAPADTVGAPGGKEDPARNPAPTAPQTPGDQTQTAGGGVLLFRLEGVVAEKEGRWNRVGESTIDGRTCITWTDPNPKHPPAFLGFTNAPRAMPAKFRVRLCYRVNKLAESVRLHFNAAGKGTEQPFATFPISAADVGTWQTVEAIGTTNANLKDELYLKLGNYPDGYELDVDWLELYDLTQTAGTAPNLVKAPPLGTPPQQPPPGSSAAPANPAVPAGPAPGTRLFGQPAGAKKLTTLETKVTGSPSAVASMATAGPTSRLFDGDASNGIYSVASSDPKSNSCWLMLDLGAEQPVTGIKVFTFFTAARTYGAQVWQVCPNDDFLRGVVTVYNADAANVQGQGAGADPSNQSVREGQSAFFAPVRARYVRLWFNGNNDNKDNHILEIEVYGAEGAPAAVDPHLAAGDLKINAGRGTVGDWKTESGYALSGIDEADAKPVALPKGSLVLPDKLYNSFRGGTQAWNFSKVPDGNYWVRLHFQEPQITVAGMRLFDVIVNDSIELKDYDIFVAAGGAHKAVVETIAAVAIDGKGIKLEFKLVKGAPLVCGIEILPTEGPVAPPARMVAP